MTQSFSQNFKIEAPREAVCAAMRNPALIEESEKSRDALEVQITDLERTDSLHKYQIELTTYAKGVTGIDKNKTEKNRTVVTWDTEGLKGQWEWSGEHGSKVTVKGGYVLHAEGDGTRIEMRAEATVAIPLVGKVVEKKIRKGFEENWPPYIERVTRFAKQS